VKHTIKKINKKLFVVDETGKPVYTPPNFLKPIQSRENLQEIVEGFDSGIYPSEAITAFETRFNPRLKMRGIK